MDDMGRYGADNYHSSALHRQTKRCDSGVR